MTDQSSATGRTAVPLPYGRAGVLWGFVGVVAFSFTLPFTRVAVGGFSPLLVGSGRAVVAALLAAVALTVTRQRLPSPRQGLRLAVVAAGVVVGFPLLTTYAMTTAPASHGAAVVALLPAATAVTAALRTRERPRTSFWVLAGTGAVLATGFASLQGDGTLHLGPADLLLLGAVVAGAIGYAEGGLLAREIGAWQTVSWALVVCAPVMAALAVVAAMDRPASGTPAQWAALGYLAVVSMFLGFFAWYRGLAIGPMSRVSQVQLVQPVLSIAWAALLLREQLTWSTVLGGVAVVLCAGLAIRTRAENPGPRVAVVPGPG